MRAGSPEGELRTHRFWHVMLAAAAAWILWLGAPGLAAANAAPASLDSVQCALTDGSVAGDWRLPTRAEWLATMQGTQRLIAAYASNCPAPPLKANDGTTCFQAVPQGSGANQPAFVNVVAGGYWS